MNVQNVPEKKGAVYHIDERVTPSVAVSRAKCEFVDSRKGYDYNEIKARHYGNGADGHVVVVLYDLVSYDG